jgi:hypothetical protein
MCENYAFSPEEGRGGFLTSQRLHDVLGKVKSHHFRENAFLQSLNYEYGPSVFSGVCADLYNSP